MRFRGAVTRFTTFYGEDALTYLDLVGGQSWRMARAHVKSAYNTADIGREAEHLSCLADFLTTDLGQPVKGTTGTNGLGLPHLQLLALRIATDLRHHASIAGANLQTSKNQRKAAKGSMAFSSFFRLLSCRIDEDVESLHKVFGPFASLAIRIGALICRALNRSDSHGTLTGTRLLPGTSFLGPGAASPVAAGRLEV